MEKRRFVVLVALIVALGGFLMGFDASVISGVNEFIEPEFNLSKLELGWAVASLTLTATLAMLLAGPISDRIGRKAAGLLGQLFQSIDMFRAKVLVVQIFSENDINYCSDNGGVMPGTHLQVQIRAARHFSDTRVDANHLHTAFLAFTQRIVWAERRDTTGNGEV